MVNEIDNDVTVLNEDLPKLFNTYVKWKLVLYSVKTKANSDSRETATTTMRLMIRYILA